MNAPTLQVLWLHRRLFLGVMCLAFLALAIGVAMLPEPRAIVRSSIELGSAVVNGRQEPIQQPEEVAKRITEIYAPAVVLEMAKKGTSQSVLSAVQNSTAQSFGRNLVVISVIDLRGENEAKEFQEAIAARVIKEQAPRVQLLRDGTAMRIASATKASDELDQQIKAITADIERISAFSDSLRGQIENQRANFPTLYQRAGAAQQSGERSTIEAEIRGLHEQISSQTTLLGTLTLERTHLTRDLASTRRQHEAQIKALGDAQFEQTSFNETRISLPPSLMPATTAPSRRRGLLCVALVISVLVGLGTVVLLHNVVERKI
jgi:hypothetical protein